MTACVFLGPSMPVAEARKLLPGTVFLPPARKGDIVRAITDHAPTTVALIDGCFEQTPAVWHKEILWALDQGIEVWGAASMGALRACELRQFGMRGIGHVYRAYVDNAFPPFAGPFEDDDEVAVVHGPHDAGYLSTDAMVDIRATLAAAEDEGIIDAALRDELAAIAKAIFYKKRTYAAMLAAATARGLDTAILAAFRDWLARGRVSLKRADAEEVLWMLAGPTAPRPRPVFHFERTLLWSRSGLEPGYVEPDDDDPVAALVTPFPLEVGE